MKEDKNILKIKHFCPNCETELELSSTDEIQSDLGTLSILIYSCSECETRLDVIDNEKVYLNEVQDYLFKNIIVNIN